MFKSCINLLTHKLSGKIQGHCYTQKKLVQIILCMNCECLQLSHSKLLVRRLRYHESARAVSSFEPRIELGWVIDHECRQLIGMKHRAHIWYWCKRPLMYISFPGPIRPRPCYFMWKHICNILLFGLFEFPKNIIELVVLGVRHITFVDPVFGEHDWVCCIVVAVTVLQKYIALTTQRNWHK